MAVTTPGPERPVPAEPATDATARLARQLTDVRGILAAAGLIMYVVLRLAYIRFYEPFGVSPEDLGFDYVAILAQSAAGAVLVTAVVTVAVSLVPVAVSGHRATSAQLVAMLAGCGLAAAVDRWAGELGAPLALVVMAAVVAPGAVFVREGLRSDRPFLGRPSRLWWRAIVAVMVAVIAFGSGWLLRHQAAADAANVARGWPATPDLWGVPLASWHADAATVSWIGTPKDQALRRLAGPCLMYLGESDGTVYLVRPASDPVETLRLPAHDVVVHVLPGRRCR